MIANLVFNMFNVVLDWVMKVRDAKAYSSLEFTPSNFDTSVGCAFAVVGIFACTRNDRYVRHLATIAFGLCLLILLVGLVVTLLAFSPTVRTVFVVALDLLAFSALLWAIDKAG